MRKHGSDDPARLEDLIGEVGARLGLRRPAAVGALWARWREVVGEDIAANAEPTSLRDGVLRIRTQSPAWATEIGYLRDEIRRRVNETTGSDLVREVRVWTGPGAISARLQPNEQAGAAEGSATPVQRPARRSPAEALDAARTAWRKRRAGGRSAASSGSEEGAPGPPRTPEKGS